MASRPSSFDDSRLPASACPACGSVQTMASDPLDESATPEPGDLAICFDCGTVNVFSEAMTLRFPTEAERAEIGAEPKVTDMQRAVAKMDLSHCGSAPNDWLESDGADVRGCFAWLIIGGESGPGARPLNLRWVSALVRQCREAGIATFVKQLGAVPMEPEADWRGRVTTRTLSARNRDRVPAGFVPLKLNDAKGGEPAEWPDELRVREFPA